MKIAILGHQEITSIVIQQFILNHVKIYSLISLCSTKGKSISEYVDCKSMAKSYDLNHFEVDDYSLNSDHSQNFFHEEKFDFIFVVGWSRLIPDSLIKKHKFIGWHGGPYLPPRCRGRAVVNWSIINNETDFYIYSILLDKGVDSGKILGLKNIRIENNETAKTLYIKCAYEVFKLFIEILLEKTENSTLLYRGLNPTYLPKRSPEDGAIDWSLSASVIDRLVRALSKPFPPAWCVINDNKLEVLRTKVLDIQVYNKYKYGQIIHILENGELLVMTSRGLLLIEEYKYSNKSDLKSLMVFKTAKNNKNVTINY